MPIIKVTIPGIPIAKKRARSQRFGRPYNCQRREENQFIIQANTQIKKKAPRTEPVRIRCWFWFPIPKSKDRRQIDENHGAHIVKPDGDNLIKFVKDCLNGLAWEDDCQVSSAEYHKLYGGDPRTEIEIEWLERIKIESMPGVKVRPQRLLSEPI